MNRIFIFLIASLMAIPGHSQWESMHGPEGGSVSTILRNSSYYFVKTSNGLYRSTNGANWEHIQLELPSQYNLHLIDLNDSILLITLIAYHHTTDSSLLFKSIDQGNTWHQLDPPHLYSASGLRIIDNMIIYSGREALWRSRDFGDTWEPSDFLSAADYIYDIYGDKSSALITAIGSKEFRYQPATDTWTDLLLPDGIYFSSLFEFDTVLFAFTSSNGHMFRSGDDGATWKLISTINWDQGYPIMCETVNGMYAFANGNLYTSTDKGITWITTNLLDFECNGMHSAEDGIFLSTDNGIYLLSETDFTLQPTFSGIIASRVGNLHKDLDYLWFSSSGQGVSRINTTSNEFEFNLYAGSGIEDIISIDGRVFALQNGKSVIRSNDNGATWKSASPNYLYPPFYQLFAHNGVLYVGGVNIYPSKEFLKSNDYGSNWDPFLINGSSGPYLISGNGNLLFAADDSKLFRSTNNGMTWEPVDLDVCSGCFIYRLVSCENIVFTIANNSSLRKYQTYISKDEGKSWNEITFDPAEYGHYHGFNDLMCVEDYIIGTSTRGKVNIHVSTDLGLTWKLFNQGLNTPTYYDGMAADDTYIYIGTIGQGLWRRKIADILATNTKDDSRAQVLNIFPNPTSGYLSFHSNALQSLKAFISLTDLTGKKVFSTYQMISFGTNSIDITSLDKGLYILSVETKDSIVTGKVLLF